MALARNALDDLRLIHKVLNRLKIPHAIIGGWAAIAWGAVRATKDLDLLVLVKREDRERIKRAFERLGYEAEWRKGDIDDPIRDLLRLSPKKAGGRPAVDLLPTSRAFDLDAIERAVPIKLEHLALPVVCREDLIAMKLLAGGGVDFQDAKTLFSIHEKTLDLVRLENSCRSLKVESALKLIRTLT